MPVKTKSGSQGVKVPSEKAKKVTNAVTIPVTSAVTKPTKTHKSTNAAAPTAVMNEPGSRKKKGLRDPQVRILKALSTESAALSRRQISEKANVNLPMLLWYIGSDNEEKREKNDLFFPSLLTLKLIKAVDKPEGQRGSSYIITAAGIKAAAKLP